MINFGINDLLFSSANADIFTIQNNLSLATRAARNRGADVLLLVPPLDYVNGSTTQRRLRQGIFKQAIWDVGRSHGVALRDLGEALGHSATWATTGWYSSNTNPHPNEAGYQADANYIWTNVLSV